MRKTHNVGHARHLVVAPNGVVYVNTWSGRYYGNDTPPAGGFLVALQDTNGDGRADVNVRFGAGVQSGSAGGTGIALYRGALFAEADDRIVRYALPAGGIAPTEAPATIVSGLPLTGDHPMHPFAIDARGTRYVNLGSATNSCQVQNRMPNSPGHRPCTELETRAGIWRYDAKRTGQQFSPAERFVTGLRNAGGIAVDSTGVGIYATQHGRDQLSENWSSLYRPEQGANEPAEELVRVKRGADYGWPECYFDGAQRKLVLAPEYGGDGGKAVGPCAQQHAVYRASKAFGKIIKSLFILRIIDDVELRQAIERQLAKIEHAHRFTRAVSVGNPREFIQAEKQEQEIAEGCKRLLKNCIICWNYLYLSQKLADTDDPEVREAFLQAVASGSVITWRH